MTVIITTKEQLSATLCELLPGAMEKAHRANPEKLYSIAQTARKLGKKWDTVKRMIDEGRLKTTADGKYISQAAIDEYLNGK
jgi:hypothetical protein